MNRDIAKQVLEDYVVRVLRDYDPLRCSDTDPELEAVCVAILLEDTFGITLADAEIDPAALADSSAVTALVTGLAGGV